MCLEFVMKLQILLYFLKQYIHKFLTSSYRIYILNRIVAHFFLVDSKKGHVENLKNMLFLCNKILNFISLNPFCFSKLIYQKSKIIIFIKCIKICNHALIFLIYSYIFIYCFFFLNSSKIISFNVLSLIGLTKKLKTHKSIKL